MSGRLRVTTYANQQLRLCIILKMRNMYGNM
ncbi:hypothetical protein VPHK460_0215 [Vibrio phage K460]